MLRRLFTAAIVTAAAAAAVATSAVADGKPPATVKLSSCSIEGRSALFVARAREIDGGARIWLRFKLLEKGARGFHQVKAPGLDRWRKSKPGVGAFAYKQAVKGLEAGSGLRAVDEHVA